MTKDNAPIPIDEEGYVTITSPDGYRSYLLLGKINSFTEVNCVDSYTLTGGPQEPFEVLSLKIPKKKLIDISSDFDKPNSIVAGKSRISVNYYGKCDNMIVTKCKVSGNNYNITAYHECEIIRGLQIEGELNMDIISIIKYLISKVDEKLGYLSKKYSKEGGIVWRYDDTLWPSVDAPPSTSITETKVLIPPGVNAWFALQVCAMAIGCRVFFANDKVYIIDYRLPFNNKDEGFNDISEVDLYSNRESSYAYGSMISVPEYGEEGFDTVVNSITINGVGTAINDQYNMNAISISVPESIAYFGQRNASNIDTKFLHVQMCLAFGETYLSYLSEPQQSITVEFKEQSYDNSNSFTSARGLVWSPMFPVLSRVGTFRDTKDSVSVNNTDVYGNIMPQKLYLSTYTRNYPKGSSTYTFGVMDNISLSQSTSQILTAVGGIVNYK
jgi:hypothetical protein